MSDSVWPHRRQPTRLPRPWDSPGKNTGAGCHFLLQCIKAKSLSEVAQLCPTPSYPMDCSLPGSSIHGTFQTRVLEWGVIAFFVSWQEIKKKKKRYSKNQWLSPPLPLQKRRPLPSNFHSHQQSHLSVCFCLPLSEWPSRTFELKSKGHCSSEAGALLWDFSILSSTQWLINWGTASHRLPSE